MKVLCEPCGPLGANCYLLSNDQGHAILIDPSDILLAKSKLDALSLSLVGILFTHAHFDHVAPIDAIKACIDVPTFIHFADAPLLKDPHHNAAVMMGSETDLGECDVLFEDNRILFPESFRVKVIHTPGHTPGSSCFLVDNMLFSGDTLFAGGIGRCDLYGGNYFVMRHSLEKLAYLEGDFTVYPGHGAPSLLSYEKRHNPYMAQFC